MPGQGSVKSPCSLLDEQLNRCRLRPPTASPHYRILQWDNDTSEYKLVRELRGNIRDSSGTYREGWWGWNDIALDGDIRVEVRKRYSDDQYRLAADSFRLKWKELLPEDRRIAIALCQATSLHEVLEQQKVIAYVIFATQVLRELLQISVGLAVQVLLPAIPTGIASAVRGFKLIKNTADLIRVAKGISDAIRFINANSLGNTSAAAQGVLAVAKGLIQLSDDLVDAGVLDSNSEKLHSAYKRYCESPNDTLVGTDNGWPVGGTEGVGNGCDVRRYTCVPGYMAFVRS